MWQKVRPGGHMTDPYQMFQLWNKIICSVLLSSNAFAATAGVFSSECTPVSWQLATKLMNKHCAFMWTLLIYFTPTLSHPVQIDIKEKCNHDRKSASVKQHKISHMKAPLTTTGFNLHEIKSSQGTNSTDLRSQSISELKHTGSSSERLHMGGMSDCCSRSSLLWGVCSEDSISAMLLLVVGVPFTSLPTGQNRDITYSQTAGG